MRHLRWGIALIATVIAACAGPAGSLPAGSLPAPSVLPTPTPGPDGVIDAFLRSTADAARSYAMALDGSVSAVGMGAQVDIRAEVEGSNYRLTNKVSGFVMEVISAGGEKWSRLNEGTWSRGGSATLPDPFLGLARGDVSYVGPQGGAHRLSISVTDAVLNRIWDGMFTRARHTTSTFEVIVGQGGIPASADIAVAGTLQGPVGAFEVQLHYTFTRWGEAMGIALPAEVIPTPTPSPFVPPVGSIPDSALAGRLALSSWWGGPAYALVVVNLDGSNGKAWGEPSTTRDYARAQAAFSPDGRLLAFSRVACEVAKPGEICPRVIATIDASGNQRDVTTPVAGSQDDNPAWSPDGSRIVFDSSRDLPADGSDGRSLFVVDAAGGRPTRIETGLAIARLPDWAPDGDRIVFLGATDTFDGRGVYSVASTGGASTMIAAGISNSRVQWSPDGRRIGWSRYDWAGRERLVTMNADGTGLVELIEGYFQAWSPTGDVILFLQPPGAGDETSIWVVRSDGAGARRLPFAEKGRPSGLDWAP